MELTMVTYPGAWPCEARDSPGGIGGEKDCCGPRVAGLPAGSAPQSEARDHFLVALRCRALEIVEELATLVHHLQQPAARSVIALVSSEVLAELVDTCREQRDLHLRRARVVRVASILLDDSALLVGRQ